MQNKDVSAKIEAAVKSLRKLNQNKAKLTARDMVLIGQMQKNEDDDDDSVEQLHNVAPESIDHTIANRIALENNSHVHVPRLAKELLSLLLFSFKEGNPDCFAEENIRNSGNTNYLVQLVLMAREWENPVEATLTMNVMLFAMHQRMPSKSYCEVMRKKI